MDPVPFYDFSLAPDPMDDAVLRLAANPDCFDFPPDFSFQPHSNETDDVDLTASPTTAFLATANNNYNNKLTGPTEPQAPLPTTMPINDTFPFFEQSPAPHATIEPQEQYRAQSIAQQRLPSVSLSAVGGVSMPLDLDSARNQGQSTNISVEEQRQQELEEMISVIRKRTSAEHEEKKKSILDELSRKVAIPEGSGRKRRQLKGLSQLEKDLIKMDRNRRSAQRSRERKRHQATEMENQLSSLHDENQRLRHELARICRMTGATSAFVSSS